MNVELRMSRLAALAFLAALVACGPAAVPDGSSGLDEGLEHTVADSPFELTIRAGRASYRPGEVMDVSATLRYVGTGRAELGGSGGGFVVFSVRSADGRIDTEWGMDGDCARYVLMPGEAIEYPFQKSGGYSETDPDAAFMREFFRDPELSLPDGRWIVTAHAVIAEWDCGSGRTWAFEAPIELIVAP